MYLLHLVRTRSRNARLNASVLGRCLSCACPLCLQRRQENTSERAQTEKGVTAVLRRVVTGRTVAQLFAVAAYVPKKPQVTGKITLYKQLFQ